MSKNKSQVDELFIDELFIEDQNYINEDSLDNLFVELFEDKFVDFDHRDKYLTKPTRLKKGVIPPNGYNAHLEQLAGYLKSLRQENLYSNVIQNRITSLDYQHVMIFSSLVMQLILDSGFVYVLNQYFSHLASKENQVEESELEKLEKFNELTKGVELLSEVCEVCAVNIERETPEILDSIQDKILELLPDLTKEFFLDYYLNEHQLDNVVDFALKAFNNLYSLVVHLIEAIKIMDKELIHQISQALSVLHINMERNLYEFVQGAELSQETLDKKQTSNKHLEFSFVQQSIEGQ